MQLLHSHQLATSWHVIRTETYVTVLYQLRIKMQSFLLIFFKKTAWRMQTGQWLKALFQKHALSWGTIQKSQQKFQVKRKMRFCQQQHGCVPSSGRETGNMMRSGVENAELEFILPTWVFRGKFWPWYVSRAFGRVSGHEKVSISVLTLVPAAGVRERNGRENFWGRQCELGLPSVFSLCFVPIKQYQKAYL